MSMSSLLRWAFRVQSYWDPQRLDSIYFRMVLQGEKEAGVLIL
jgi:hypothetical protein